MPPKMVVARQAQACSERRQHGVDLAGELAGRGPAPGARAAGARAPVSEASDERDAEGERLARAGPAAAEHVTPGQRVGQRGRLDRERRPDAAWASEVTSGSGTPESAKVSAGPGLPGAGRRRACVSSRGTAVMQECLPDLGGRIFEGRHVRGNQLAHRATYDRRALMASPHDLSCGLTLSHASHPSLLLPAGGASAGADRGQREAGADGRYAAPDQGWSTAKRVLWAGDHGDRAVHAGAGAGVGRAPGRPGRPPRPGRRPGPPGGRAVSLASAGHDGRGRAPGPRAVLRRGVPPAHPR